jgi:MoxR-like ATPase
MQDVQELAVPVLRHRVLLNYKAEAEGITVDTIIKRLLEVPAQAVKSPVKAMVAK